jgi:hypothetical protein
MRAIFGTNARCQMDAERKVTDTMLSDAERKIARLEVTLDMPQDDRPAANIDEALRQITAGRH